MAKPVGFGGANSLMLAPEGDSECLDLQVFNDGNQVISCWQLSDTEIANLIETRCVWLSIKGAGMPRVLLSGEALVDFEGQPSKPEPYIAPATRKD